MEDGWMDGYPRLIKRAGKNEISQLRLKFNRAVSTQLRRIDTKCVSDI